MLLYRLMAHVTWSKHRQVMISRVVINTKRFYRTDVMQGQSRVRSANVAGEEMVPYLVI
jgi:hypothetical protein